MLDEAWVSRLHDILTLCHKWARQCHQVGPEVGPALLQPYYVAALPRRDAWAAWHLVLGQPDALARCRDGIRVILDMHQDSVGAATCGERGC